jgi:hypothetical protein
VTALEDIAKAAKAWNPTTTEALSGPWTSLSTTVDGVFKQMILDAQKAALDIGTEMQKIIDKAHEALNAVNSFGATQDFETALKYSEGKRNSGTSSVVNMTDVAALQEVLRDTFKRPLIITGVYDEATKSALEDVQNQIGVKTDGLYGSATRTAMVNYLDTSIKLSLQSGQDTSAYKDAKSKLPRAFYAKGTTGTTHDEWAVTDEIGDELVLIPGKNGNLQYMRKGTAVIPAEISANLMEWGKLNPNMDMSGAVQGVNLMTNVVNKPELNLSFDALVKAERVTEETLPALKQLVTEELDKFTRKLNYNLKRVGSTV